MHQGWEVRLVGCRFLSLKCHRLAILHGRATFDGRHGSMKPGDAARSWAEDIARGVPKAWCRFAV
jgi:hypothetical protein